MIRHESLYPNYDVLALQDEWDANTRGIVLQRLGPFQFKLLSKWQQDMVKAVARHLAHDNRTEILTWIAAYLDEQLRQPVGNLSANRGCRL
jgi:hypothetical protein